jgi:hypothetical protein
MLLVLQHKYRSVTMVKRGAYMKQFKPGTVPDQHWDESVRVNAHEPDSPSTVRKRQGVARGSQAEANPGLVGKQDYKRKGRK